MALSLGDAGVSVAPLILSSFHTSNGTESCELKEIVDVLLFWLRTSAVPSPNSYSVVLLEYPVDVAA